MSCFLKFDSCQFNVLILKNDSCKIILQRLNNFFFYLLFCLFPYSKHIGYSWCVETIKSSMYAPLAAELDLNKAVMFLKQDDIPQAIETLKYFERKEGTVAVNAAINLTFIYLMVNFFLNKNRKFINS